VKKPVLLDLFCGAGGCSVGYARAGFYVVGVDIEPHKDYPYQLTRANAIGLLQRLVFNPKSMPEFDVIHASPPCQAMTTMSNRYRGTGGRADSHVNLIAQVRTLLQQWGGPYVIENVPGAKPHMRSPITLTGGMFGLGVERPRLFESNVALLTAPAPRVKDPVGVYGKSHDGRRLFTRTDGTSQHAASSLKQAQDAMGIDWMTDWADITEAIPPAYTQHIGEQLIDYLARAA